MFAHRHRPALRLNHTPKKFPIPSGGKRKPDAPTDEDREKEYRRNGEAYPGGKVRRFNSGEIYTAADMEDFDLQIDRSNQTTLLCIYIQVKEGRERWQRTKEDKDIFVLDDGGERYLYTRALVVYPGIKKGRIQRLPFPGHGE
jgi:hypothetical protein